MCNRGKLRGGDGGLKRRHTHLSTDQVVEVAYRTDGGCFVVLDSYDEPFFCAQDNLYSVKSHRMRLTRMWMFHNFRQRDFEGAGITS